jgi:hypothetical protein
LFGGMGVAIVLGAVMTVEGLMRFVVPAVPLLVTGVLLAVPATAESRPRRPAGSGAAGRSGRPAG